MFFCLFYVFVLVESQGENVFPCLSVFWNLPTFLASIFIARLNALLLSLLLLSLLHVCLSCTIFHLQGPLWLYIQNHYLIWKSLIKSAESLLPCKARHSQVLEMRNVFGVPLFCPSYYDLCSRKHIAKLAFRMPFWFGTVVCSVTSSPSLLIPAPPLLFLKPLWCLVHKLPAVPLSSQFLYGPHIPPLGWVSISSSRPTSKPSSPP